MTQRLRRNVELALLGLLLIAPLTIALPMPQVIRVLVVLAAVMLAPGAAAVARLPFSQVGVYVAVVIAVSMAIGVAGATVSLWVGWWHPYLLAGLLGAASFALLVLDVRKITRRPSAVGAS